MKAPENRSKSEKWEEKRDLTMQISMTRGGIEPPFTP